MKAFNLSISLFIIFLLVIGLTSAREGLTQEDILRIHQQLSQQDNEGDTVSAYESSVVHGGSVSNPDSVSSVSVEFHINNPDTTVGTIGNQRANGARTDHRRKIIRMKNPVKNAERQHRQNQQTVDSNVGGSNQYAGMQYILPPDDFINQMRVENQIQQQNIAQYSTTQQPSYQYQPISVGQSELQYASSQAPPLQYELQSDPQHQLYAGTATPVLQFASTGNTDSYQATPLPSVKFLSSPNPDNLYSVTPGVADYAGSVENYNSNPLSQIQYSPQIDEQSYQSTPIPKYGTRVSPSGPTPHYENADYNKNIQIDHFNHAVSGVRYPFNMQQFQNEMTTAMPMPSTTAITNQLEEAWRLALNGRNGYDSVANLHDSSQSQPNNDATNGRNGLNYLINQQSRNVNENGKSYTSDSDREAGQRALYSHGDYGWKLNGKKLQNNYGVGSYEGGSAYYSTGNTRQRAESLQPNLFINQMPAGQQINNIKSIQSLSYKSESSGPQDVNVGYSIGVGSNRNYNDNANKAGHNLADIMTAMQGYQQAQTSQQVLNSMSSNDNNQHSLESHKYGQPNRNRDSMQNTANMQSDSIFQTNPSNGLFSQSNAGSSIGPNVNGNSQNVVSTFYGNLHKNSGTPNKDQQKLNLYGPNTELLSSSESKHQFEQSALNQIQPYTYTQPQTDLVTAFPHPYNMFRDDAKVNQYFDHAKALKNIQPIDLTNVVQNANEGTTTRYASPDNVNSPRYDHHSQNFANGLTKTYSAKNPSQDTNEYLESDNSNHFRNYRDNNRPLTDAFYKDTNVGYGFNIKPKPDHNISPTDATKLKESFNFDLQNQTPYQPQNTYLHNDNLKQLQTTNTHQTQAVIPFGYQSNSNRGPEQLKTLFQINNVNDPTRSYSLGPINNLNSQVVRINQDMNSHNLEASTKFINKLNLLDNKHTIGFSHPGELNLQNQAMMTVNGIRVANPYNVDLNLVSELLKGKPAVDDTRMLHFRDNLSRMIPLKLDTSSFQQILSKSENSNNQKPDLVPTLHSKKDYTNYGNLGSIGSVQYRSAEEAMGTNPSGFDETQYDESVMTGPQNSYQSIYKSSRSQEDDSESVPIISAEASNIHPIGAVLEQSELNRQQEQEAVDETDFTNQNDDEQESFENVNVKNIQTYELRDPHISGTDNHATSLAPGRNNISLKQLNEAEEPYPLLKPPRPPRNRPLGHQNNEKRLRFHRVASLKQNRLPNKIGYFSENPSANDYDVNVRIPFNLRPPAVLKRKTSTIITE